MSSEKGEEYIIFIQYLFLGVSNSNIAIECGSEFQTKQIESFTFDRRHRTITHNWTHILSWMMKNNLITEIGDIYIYL